MVFGFPRLALNFYELVLFSTDYCYISLKYKLKEYIIAIITSRKQDSGSQHTNCGVTQMDSGVQSSDRGVSGRRLSNDIGVLSGYWRI